MKNIKTITLEGNPSQNGHGNGIAYSTGVQATIFKDGGTFGYCLHGVGEGGHAWEGDDIDGFEKETEAEKAAVKAYEENKNRDDSLI